MNNHYSKGSLRKLITIVTEIANDSRNQWFKEELISTLTSGTDSIMMMSKKMSKIETHLSLDGIEILDFKGIDDQNTLSQLKADNIQMQKYRLGKIDNKIDFAEYCRYAHYQAEELINYYFNKKFNAVQHATKYFEHHNEIFDEDWKTFESIPYYKKMKVLTAEIRILKGILNLKDDINLSDVLYKINEVRNEKSHRSSLLIKKDDDAILKEIEEVGIDLKQWKSYEKTSEEYRLYNKGKSILFRRTQNFDNIRKAIYQLNTMIVYLLQTRK